ncbi:hypothetical protein [Stutzerimonas zhaodongensis]|uniref:hypothetical protein n=1 Tax=Stutzerimonas TaxID=2901164 RepID=UPI00388F9571
MITPALVILLMVIGWSTAALAMLWGMLRIARHHHKSDAAVQSHRQLPPAAVPRMARVSLTACKNLDRCAINP